MSVYILSGKKWDFVSLEYLLKTCFRMKSRVNSFINKNLLWIRGYRSRSSFSAVLYTYISLTPFATGCVKSQRSESSEGCWTVDLINLRALGERKAFTKDHAIMCNDVTRQRKSHSVYGCRWRAVASFSFFSLRHSYHTLSSPFASLLLFSHFYSLFLSVYMFPFSPRFSFCTFVAGESPAAVKSPSQRF